MEPVVAEWIRWAVIALVAAAQILVIWRSEKAHTAEMRAKDAHIESLKALSSPLVLEAAKATEESLTKYIDQLKSKNSEAQGEIQQLKAQNEESSKLLRKPVPASDVSVHVSDFIESFEDRIEVIHQNIHSEQDHMRETIAERESEIDQLKREAEARNLMIENLSRVLQPVQAIFEPAIYTQVTFGYFLAISFNRLEAEQGIVFQSYPRLILDWDQGDWLYEILNDFSVRIFRWQVKDAELTIRGPWENGNESRAEFQDRFYQDLVNAVAFLSTHKG